MVDLYNQFKDFKSFEVVFFDKEKRLQKLFCSVKSIENNSVVLDVNNERNKNIFAEVGDDLKLYIYTETGIYSAASKVLLLTRGLVSSEYVIAYPANSKHSQRREYFRAAMPVKFKMEITSDYDQSEPIIIESQVRNICGKGMSYISDTLFPDYDSIRVELYFDDRRIKTTADLVYTNTTIINSRQKFIHAFTFPTINKKNVEFIIKKCFLFQLDTIKKY